MSWQTLALGDICDVIGGGTPSKHRADFYEGDIPWASIRDIQGDWVESTEFSITEKAIASSATNVIPSGNVIIATRVGLGKVARLRRDTAINQDIRAVVPRDDKKLDKQYLFYWFKSIAKIIESEGKGATVKGVTLPFVKSLQLPLPTLPEQHRIVALLDEAFAGIAIAKANAEKNLRNAQAIFDIHLQDVFSGRGPMWGEKSLGDLADFRNGINFTKTSKGKRVRVLGVKDFKDRFHAPDDGLDHVTIDGDLDDGDVLRSGDLVFVRSNGNPELIGRSVVIGDMSERTTHSGFTIRARLRTDDVAPDYLGHFLKSDTIRKQMVDGGTGTNIKSLNQGTLSRVLVPYPARAEQARIVKKLEAVRAETQHLQYLTTRKLAALAELKQSLLQRAFSGQL